MDKAFKGLVNRCIVIYMDNLIVFLKNIVDHIVILKQVLIRCQKYGISLNPKQCVFGVTKGKLLESGISINAERFEEILNLFAPNNQKELKSFFDMISFFYKFIGNIAKIVPPLNNMLKKRI